jgi:DNA-binding XRE family transcriptional regulator
MITETPNPFKLRRQQLGINQDQAAARVGITRQTFVELEVGLFRKVPPSALRALASSQADGDALAESYYAWVAQTRHENSRVFFEYEVESFDEYATKIGGSLRGFCRALVIQRSLAQDYLRHGRNWDYIEACLLETGISQDYCDHLKGLPRASS